MFVVEEPSEAQMELMMIVREAVAHGVEGLLALKVEEAPLRV